MTVATTLKLPEALKARIARLAKQSHKSAHSLMIEALEREERMQSFVREALAADAEIEAGAIREPVGWLANHPMIGRRVAGELCEFWQSAASGN